MSGLDVRLIARRGKDALVETVGVVLRGQVPADALAVSCPDFLYPEPGGPLFKLRRAAQLVDPRVPERTLARVEAGEEVVGILEDAGQARVRTYGPLALEGLVPRDALAPAERKQVTLDSSGAPDHEVNIDTELYAEAGGKILGRIRAGTPVLLEERRGEMARVFTLGDVRTRGLVAVRPLIRLTPVNEGEGPRERDERNCLFGGTGSLFREPLLPPQPARGGHPQH